MRTLSAAQLLALESAHREVRWRVYVDSTGGGVWQNLCSLSGYDWVQGMNWSEDIDNQVSSASVTLSRNVHGLNLSPFMSESKLNNGIAMIAIGRAIYIETATLTYGASPASTDYVRVWQGYIDTIDPQGESIELQCSDQGSVIRDKYITEQAEYGDALGQAITDLIQELLDDNLGPAVVTLNVVGSPTFLILPYRQDKQPLLEALNALVVQMGWDLRYKWDSGSSTFKLTLWTPDRANTGTPAYSFTKHDLLDISQLRISVENIRNQVHVNYLSAALGIRQDVTVTDSASETKYRERWMEFTEASTSQIDTEDEAEALAEAALADLKEPNADHSVRMHYFWPAELGDLYEFGPNDILYDTTQYFAVVGIKHSFADGKYETELTTRGAPSTRYRGWLQMEGRPGVAPNVNMFDPSAPQNVAVSQKPMGFTLSHDVPSIGTRWARTEVYVVTHPTAFSQSTTNGKFNPPSGTLVASARSTQISVDNLLTSLATQTVKYNVCAVIVDTEGNYGAKSSTIAINVTRVGADFQNRDSADYSLLRNADFNQFSRGLDHPPDFWSVTNGTWDAPSSGAEIYYVTDQGSGKYSLQLYTKRTFGVTEVELVSEFIPFVGNEVITYSCAYMFDAAGVGYTVTLAVEFYDIDSTLFATESTTNGVVDDDATGSWYVGLTGIAFSYSATRYIRCRLLLTATGTTDGSGLSFFVDRIGLARGRPLLNARCQYVSNQFTASSDQVIHTGTALDGTAGFSYQATPNAWLCLVAGYYTIRGQVGLNSNNAFSDSDWADLWIEVSDDAGSSWDPYGYQKCVTDGNGHSSVTCTTPTIWLGRDYLIRFAINPTEDFELDSSKVSQSSFTAECISRGDSP